MTAPTMGEHLATLLRKLRSLPPSERHILAITIYLTIAIVILLFWISSLKNAILLPETRSLLPAEATGTASSLAPATSLLSPFKTMAEAIREAGGRISQLLQEAGQRREEIPGQAPVPIKEPGQPGRAEPQAAPKGAAGILMGLPTPEQRVQWLDGLHRSLKGAQAP